MTDRQVFIIAGAGGTAYGQNEIQDLVKRFDRTTETTQITLIGDGYKPVDVNWLKDKINLLNTDIPTTFVIQAHGEIDDKSKQHVLCLEGEFTAGGYVYKGDSTDTSSLFQVITDKFKSQSIDVFMTSCHGGGALHNVDILPAGSGLSILSSESESVDGGAVKKWIESKEQVTDLSAKGLLKSYFHRGLEMKSAPNYAESGRGFLNPALKLVAKIGQEFSQDEKTKIHQALDSEIGHVRVLDIMDTIKEGSGEDSIPALKYGDALSAIVAIQDKASDFDDFIDHKTHSKLLESYESQPIRKEFSRSSITPRMRHIIDMPVTRSKKRLFSPFD